MKQKVSFVLTFENDESFKTSVIVNKVTTTEQIVNYFLFDYWNGNQIMSVKEVRFEDYDGDGIPILLLFDSLREDLDFNPAWNPFIDKFERYALDR